MNQQANSRWRMAGALGVAIGVVAGVLCASPAGATPDRAPAAPVDVAPPLPFPIPPLPPEFDPGFYRPAAAVVAQTPPGGLIAARQVHLANFSLIPVNVDAWQVSYRSNNTRDEPIAAVATLIKPRGATRDGGPRPLLSFQSAEDSLALYCAPSYVFQQGSVPYTLTGSASVGAEFLQVQAALTQGWAVVVSDNQGPNSAYAAGPLEGRITLDGIRAAENFEPLGLAGVDTRVGMTGYSGGAIATNWAAELHPTYAPELNIVGVAAGGTQPNLEATLNLANGNLTSGLILAAVLGLGREYPEFAEYLDRSATPPGRLLMDLKQNLCLQWTAALAPFVDNKALLNGDPLAAPEVRRVIEATRLGRTVPTAPLYQYQSNPDWIAPVAQVDELVDTYCQDPNARVTYVRDHFSEHVSMALVATPAWMLWLRDRFAGVPVADGCTVHDVGSIALDPATWPLWSQVIGDELAGLFGKPLGA